MSAWHVVKVGGSLFELPDLSQRLRDWLSRQEPGRIVLVAGGGELTDVIRRADERFRLGEEASHWLSVDALRVAAGLLARLLPETRLVVTWDDLLRTAGQPMPIPAAAFDPADFLCNVEPSLAPPALPHTWQVTTDSIAARIAQSLAARRLTLLKSAPPSSSDLHELAALGYVDEYFPTAAEGIANVRFVDLRSKEE